jgi:SWI/SNF-related matrix-associated actin-dependent regulator of chromatin subfamily A-like protein 1
MSFYPPRKRRSVIELSAGADLSELLQQEWKAFRTFESSGSAPEEYNAKVRSLKLVRLKARDNLAIVRHQTALAKVPLVVEFVTEVLHSGAQKVVLFAHHRDVIQSLDERLGRFHPVQLIGGMSPLAKQRAIDQFRTDPLVRIFLGNIHAAGLGIDLSHCSHCIFAELDWTPGIVSQAEDRCHRIGTEESVLVQHLVLAGSVDAIMARRILAKQEVLDAVLDC